MILEPDTNPRVSLVSSIDPRLRIIAAAMFSIVLVLGSTSAAPGVVIALLIAVCARVRIQTLFLRLLPLNALMLVLIATLPFSVAGESMFLLGPLSYSFDGFRQAIIIACKGNAIVTMLTALIATIELVQLGHALEQLYVPKKLTRLFLFTVRYFAVIDSEYNRLNRAMMMRGFRPRLNIHTLRSYAYLAGMLLVHALDRSERILDAMRCRGFDGHFRPFETRPKSFSLNDGVFTLMLVGWTLVLITIDYGAW